MKKTILLAVLILLVLGSCKQKKFRYKIIGYTQEQVKAVWQADSFSLSRDTLIIVNTDCTKYKILEPYIIYENDK